MIWGGLEREEGLLEGSYVVFSFLFAFLSPVWHLWEFAWLCFEFLLVCRVLGLEFHPDFPPWYSEDSAECECL